MDPEDFIRDAVLSGIKKKQRNSRYSDSIDELQREGTKLRKLAEKELQMMGIAVGAIGLIVIVIVVKNKYEKIYV